MKLLLVSLPNCHMCHALQPLAQEAAKQLDIELQCLDLATSKNADIQMYSKWVHSYLAVPQLWVVDDTDQCYDRPITVGQMKSIQHIIATVKEVIE